MLENGPLGGSVHALNDCWLYFESGVLTSDNPECQGEGRPLDHAVTIVGFHHGRASDTSTGGNGGGAEETDSEYNRTCRWALEEERLAGQCSGANETFAPNRKGEENRKCCWYEPIPALAYEETGGEENVYDFDNSYWIIQNSFGKWWGDQGFIYLKAETGFGPS